MDHDTPRFLTMSELREHLDTAGFSSSRRTVMRWIRLGLPSHQPGGSRGRLYFDWAEVEAWVRSRCSPRDRKAGPAYPDERGDAA